MRSSDQQRKSLPQVMPQRGFSWLPVSEQVVVVSLVGVLLLTFFPIAIDATRATGGRIGPAIDMPPSILVARQRLARHYAVRVWLREGSPTERRLRLKVLGLVAGCIMLGAGAGRVAQQPMHSDLRPMHYGVDDDAHAVRARAVLGRLVE